MESYKTLPEGSLGIRRAEEHEIIDEQREKVEKGKKEKPEDMLAFLEKIYFRVDQAETQIKNLTKSTKEIEDVFDEGLEKLFEEDPEAAQEMLESLKSKEKRVNVYSQDFEVFLKNKLGAHGRELFPETKEYKKMLKNRGITEDQLKEIYRADAALGKFKPEASASLRSQWTKFVREEYEKNIKPLYERPGGLSQDQVKDILNQKKDEIIADIFRRAKGGEEIEMFNLDIESMTPEEQKKFAELNALFLIDFEKDIREAAKSDSGTREFIENDIRRERRGEILREVSKAVLVDALMEKESSNNFLEIINNIEKQSPEDVIRKYGDLIRQHKKKLAGEDPRQAGLSPAEIDDAVEIAKNLIHKFNEEQAREEEKKENKK